MPNLKLVDDFSVHSQYIIVDSNLDTYRYRHKDKNIRYVYMYLRCFSTHANNHLINTGQPERVNEGYNVALSQQGPNTDAH